MQRFLKRLYRLVRLGRFDVRLRRTAPHRDEPARSAGFLKRTNVVAQLLGQIHLRLALLHVRPVDLLHVVVIEHGRARRDRRKKRLQLVEQCWSSTPAFEAASYMLSSKMSQPVKTRSSSPASGTNSLIFGERPSVRLPSRTVPICVSDPIGLARPLRIASTPATNVVATAPMPGIITPSFPFAGWIVPWWRGLLCAFPSDFTSTRGAFDAVFAALFRVAIFWTLPQ